MTNIRAMAAALALTIWMIMGADGLAEPAAEIRQEVWGLSLPIPMPAYVAKPAGEGPFPLVVMNHGESLDATARGFFPRAEFRDAALWFARQGYLVVAPVRPGFRTSSIDFPERGLYGIYFGEIGECARRTSAIRGSR